MELKTKVYKTLQGNQKVASFGKTSVLFAKCKSAIYLFFSIWLHVLLHESALVSNVNIILNYFWGKSLTNWKGGFKMQKVVWHHCTNNFQTTGRPDILKCYSQRSNYFSNVHNSFTVRADRVLEWLKPLLVEDRSWLRIKNVGFIHPNANEGQNFWSGFFRFFTF